MPRAPRSQTYFRLDLEREFEDKFEDEAVDMLKDIADRVFDIAQSRTRVRTGKLKRTWGITVGPKPDLRRRGKGALSRVGVGKGLFVHNGDFRASWHEHGTVKMSPRPMLRPAIYAVRGMQR